jgi:hypothetical protein
MPDFDPLVAMDCILLPPVNAACAPAIALSLLSGEGERESSPSCSSSMLLWIAAVLRASPSIVIGRRLGGSSSLGDSTPLLAAPAIVPGGNNMLLRLTPSFFGSCELDMGLGRREGDSSIFADHTLCAINCVSPMVIPIKLPQALVNSFLHVSLSNVVLAESVVELCVVH